MPFVYIDEFFLTEKHSLPCVLFGTELRGSVMMVF